MRAHLVYATLISAAWLVPPSGEAAEPCGKAEAGLMKSGGVPRQHAASGATPLALLPQLGLGEAHELSLSPQSTVSYAVKPGRDRVPAKATGGLARLHIEEPGQYSVLLSSSHWVDLVRGDAVVDSVSHEGHLGCEGLHKIVRYELGRGDYLLQLSGGDAAFVRLAILAQEPPAGVPGH